MNIKDYYKVCGGIILGTEEEKIEKLRLLEKSKEWVAESKNDGIWFVLIGENNKTIGFTRRGNEKEHGLPHIGNGNIIIGELSESTEKAIERKAIVGHNFIDVFDIIMYKGRNIKDLNLMERKSILKQWYNELPKEHLTYFNYVVSHENNFDKLYAKEDEGIVLKQKNGIYNSYGWDWIKVKKEQTWDMVILNYVLSTAESKSYAPIAKSLILGQYSHNKLIPMTKVPISVDIGLDVVQNFDKYKYQIVEIKGFSRTKKGSVRSPVFVRFRDDKNIKDCVFN